MAFDVICFRSVCLARWGLVDLYKILAAADAVDRGRR